MVDEFNRFCREASPFVGTVMVVVVGDGLTEFFLLKFSKIEAISGDMFCGVLLAMMLSGSSDICENKNNWIIWINQNDWVDLLGSKTIKLQGSQ